MHNVRIRVKGQIDRAWSDWFHDLELAHVETEDMTVLSGTVADQAALYGLLARLRDIGLALISVESEEVDNCRGGTP